MSQKKLIIFMPIIEGGGVEKNLFLVSNYLKDKINNICLITVSKKFRNKFNKKIKFISPKNEFWGNRGRKSQFIVSLYLLLIEILKNKNIVVISFQANLYCTILCKLFNIKIIVRPNSSPQGWTQNIIKYYCFKYLFRLADKIIVNSLDFKKEFKSKFNLKSICIYNPLNKRDIIKYSKIKSKINFSNKKINLINVGRLVYQKDQMTLLRSLITIKGKLNFRLLIVGKGDKKDELLNYIHKNDLNKYVKLINYKKNPYNLIKKSDIFILSSIYEGLPNVLLEAQTLKTYIISSNCPTGPKEILLNGKAGDLFKVGDYNKLSSLIINFSKRKVENKKKVMTGYKYLSRFNYGKNLEMYFKEIKSLIN